MKKRVVALIILIIIFLISIINIHSLNQNKYIIKANKNNKIDTNNIIAFFVGDDIVEEPPNTGNYGVSIECHDKNNNQLPASVTAKWNGTKWIINVNNINNADARCNVFFNDKPKGWDNPASNTLLAKIKANNPTVNTASTLTTPGVQNTTDNEGLRSTPDDYGMSYYYRGAIENNYVSFAGMCWRIVRIDGAGNVKLTLSNYNPNEATNPCATSEDAADRAFARYDDTTNGLAGLSVFNTYNTRNAYLGFMCGTPGSSTYEAEHVSTYKSIILLNLQKWYTSKLASHESKLADVIWCNDKTVVEDLSYDVWNITPTGLGYGTEKTYYKTTQRLSPASTAVPSLICSNSTGSNIRFSNYTVDDTIHGNGALTYKIGLLTADEAMFAGISLGSANTTYFLAKNATSSNWWTMSPYHFSGYYAYEWFISSSGDISGPDVSGALGLRPAISLVGTTTVASGDGLSSSPFKIN